MPLLPLVIFDLLQQGINVQVPSLDSTIIIGILTITIGAVVNWQTSKSAAAKFQGAAEQRFVSVEKDIEEIKQDNRNQWSKIGEQGQAIARVQGEIKGKTRAHHA